MDKLTQGMNIDIKRSDGRIHGAMIMGLNKATGLVNVEWFEKGETKGKEVALEQVLKTNPGLFVQRSIATTAPAAAAPATDENTGVATRSKRAGGGSMASQLPPPTKLNGNTTGNRRTMLIENKANGNGGEGDAVFAKPQLPSVSMRTSLAPPARSTRASMAAPPERLSLAPTDLRNVGVDPNETASKLLDTTANLNSTYSAMELARDAALPSAPKSQVVSKIEEMEKNREERRAQQEVEKKKREQAKAVDPGNPNWQFLQMIRDYQAQVDYRPLRITDAVADNRISVCVRKRPMNKKELAKKEIEVITIPNKDHVIVHQPQVKVDLTKFLDNQKFRFDYSFDENSSNEMVYKFTAQPLVKTIFQQGFATCFAYGQTGSGKTHTMGGDFDGKKQNCSNGIYALTAIDVFKMLARPEYSRQLYVGCSFFEIYGAKVYDLLGKRAILRVLEDGKKSVQVVGLKEIRVETAEDVLRLIKQGSDQRTAGQTSANSNSSRSHAVFQIILRKHNTEALHGKFSLIDLAGNERGADTMASDRQTRLEGAEINKSLLALKECIRAMGRDSDYIPFRGSKLTLVLRDSFVGKNAKTCMIAMISPGMGCVENTLNTLRYADRVKELGSDDPTASTPMADEEFMLAADYDDEAMIVDDTDVNKQARKRNAAAMEDPRKRYDAVVNRMMQAEERAIDQYQDFLEQARQLDGLLDVTNDVDYDMDKFARDALKAFTGVEALVKQCKESFKKLQEHIKEEQTLSNSRR